MDRSGLPMPAQTPGPCRYAGVGRNNEPQKISGARLVEYFRSWAREKGAVQLRVTAYTANTGAIRFYRRHGFVPLETTLAVGI